MSCGCTGGISKMPSDTSGQKLLLVLMVEWTGRMSVWAMDTQWAQEQYQKKQVGEPLLSL
jgi:hypothetical protein